MDGGGSPLTGPPKTFVSNTFSTYSLSHISVLCHQSPLPVVARLLKLLSLSFSTLVSPATFLPDHVSGPLVISKSTRGSKRILTTERSEWPRTLLLSHGYYDLTFVCVFAGI